MKVIKISEEGCFPAYATPQSGSRGPYWALTHGQKGRGRWQISIPLAVREFGTPAYSDQRLPLTDVDVDIRPLGRVDGAGNPMFLMTRGQREGYIVLWHLDPGFRGGATYAISGGAEVIARGYEAQGDAGRMGGAECPVVLVTGPCTLRWERTGRLYGNPAKLVAEFNGLTWHISPDCNAAAADAAYA